MNKHEILYDDGVHKCIMLSVDSEEVGDFFLSVNQFLLIQKDSAILVDPGSDASFSEVSEAVEEYIGLDKIKYIFFSHQDPDVAGSITNWSVTTNAKFVISKLWVRFLSHYGFMDSSRLIALEDEGTKIDFGKDFLKFPRIFCTLRVIFHCTIAARKSFFQATSVRQSYRTKCLEAVQKSLKRIKSLWRGFTSVIWQATKRVDCG
jgi:hypothetical protein